MNSGRTRKCNAHLLPPGLKEEFSNEQRTPGFESLEAAFTGLKERWDKMIEAVEPWQMLLDPAKSLEGIRRTNGGHVLVRPIGITAFVRAFATGADELTIDHTRAVVNQFQNLDSAPWAGLLWNSVTNKMNVTVEAEKLASRLWGYLLGLNEDATQLQLDYKAVVDPQNQSPHLRLPAQPA